MSNTNTIRSLNDSFRQHIPSVKDVPGRVMLTQGIQSLTDTEAEPCKYLGDLFDTVRNFDDFSSANDPHGEHDFGAFEFLGQKCFWKIDIYDKTLKWGAEDPTDLSNCKRVLTVMLAIEY